MSGNLFIVSAPSGAGKTSLVHALLKSNSDIDLSISYTSRPARIGEVDGQHYHFVTRENFIEMQLRGEFLESAEVYGNFYGTSQTWISQEIARGRNILLEIDWQGAQQVRKIFPKAINIFILPPSLAALRQRLTGRGTDHPDVIATRMAAAQVDVAHVAEFDYVIINDDLNHALQELNAVVLSAKLTCSKQLARYQTLINQLQKPE
ncbi:MAG: guanylate kinase [Gallionella sp.]